MRILKNWDELAFQALKDMKLPPEPVHEVVYAVAKTMYPKFGERTWIKIK
jgi:hypothetical protein